MEEKVPTEEIPARGWNEDRTAYVCADARAVRVRKSMQMLFEEIEEAGEDEEGSWKTEFENAGDEVTCILRGLGELPEIQQILVEHAQKAIDSLN